MALTPRSCFGKQTDGRGGVLIRSADNAECKYWENRHQKEEE